MSNDTSVLPPDILTFDTIANSTTCSTINIAWDYSGETNDTLQLGIFGYTAPGADPTDPTHGSDELVQLINPNISITAMQTTWQIDVPAGEYQIQAFDSNGILFGSEPFFVNDGDTSCMGAFSTWTTPSSQATGATGSSSGEKLSRGAIAGIVIGVLAAIVAALLLLVVYARKRRMARLASRDRRGWTSLNSLKAPWNATDAAFPNDSKVDPATTSEPNATLGREKGVGDVPTHDF